MKHLILFVSISFLTAPFEMAAQISIGGSLVDTVTVASNLDTPWEILWGKDEHIWITERYGRISRLDPKTGLLEQVALLEDVHEQGEGGLLGMALHPDFENTPQVFLVYTYLENSDIKERLVRYHYESGSLTNPIVLLEGIDGASTHNGSRLAFDTAQIIYISTGDAANTSTSQNLTSLNGKILRLHTDGRIPEDNPLPGSPVWSWGHRNPQGLVFAASGLLYSSEHGPSSDDELNIIEKGRNYGWPAVRGFCDETTELAFCADSNIYEPIAAWTPTLAVAGIDLYTHADISSWTNSLLLTSLKASRLVALKLSADGRSIIGENPYFQNWFGRLRDLCISPEGEVYLAVSNRDSRGTVRAGDDRIIRISPRTATSNQESPTANAEGLLRVYPNPLQGNEFMVEYRSSGHAWLSVYNEMGSLMLRKRISPDQLQIRLSLDAPPGLYVVRIQDADRSYSQKIIKNINR